MIQVLEGESSLPERVHGHRAHGDPRPARRAAARAGRSRSRSSTAANGRLTVRAVVPGTHQRGDARPGAGRRACRATGIARWKQPIGAAAGFDAFESMVQDALDCGRDGGLPSVAGAGVAGGQDARAADGCRRRCQRRRADRRSPPPPAGVEPATSPAGAAVAAGAARRAGGRAGPRRSPQAVASRAASRRGPSPSIGYVDLGHRRPGPRLPGAVACIRPDVFRAAVVRSDVRQ